jgi:SMC interacting uncharacterized protein involved in chromosome segregation
MSIMPNDTKAVGAGGGAVRRQTLAVLPNSLGNVQPNGQKKYYGPAADNPVKSRMSMFHAPSSSAAGVGNRTTASLTPKKSAMARDSMGRRSSGFNSVMKNSRKTAAIDPRNPTEKRTVQQHSKELVQFLASHAFPAEVSLKTLANPTTQHVVDILQFVMHHIDPNYTFIDWRSEVPEFLNFLGYPFKIRKQALQNVGSPHAWPLLLAAIVWMVELIDVRYCCILQLIDEWYLV